MPRPYRPSLSPRAGSGDHSAPALPLPFPGHALPWQGSAHWCTDCCVHPQALLPCRGAVKGWTSHHSWEQNSLCYDPDRRLAVPGSELLSVPHRQGMLSSAGHLHWQRCSLIFLQALIRGLKSSSLAVSFMCQFHFFHLLVFVSLFPVLTHVPKTGSSWLCPWGALQQPLLHPCEAEACTTPGRAGAERSWHSGS